MIHENIPGRNALINGILLHPVYLVIVLAPMVPAHEKAVGHTVLIQLYSLVQPVPKHAGRRTVRPDTAAQNHDTVHIFKSCRIICTDDIRFFLPDHVQIYQEQEQASCQSQYQKYLNRFFQNRFFIHSTLPSLTERRRGQKSRSSRQNAEICGF